MTRDQASIEALRIPACNRPRPHNDVTWFSNSVAYRGRLIGHRYDGRPYVLSNFEDHVDLPSFDYLRLSNRDNEVGPNWNRLPETALILRPHESEVTEFKRLLAQRTPPGPQYMDLVTELYERGYEVYVVGGTVRDVIAGKPTKDVDLVTTIPLHCAAPIWQSMYREPRDLQDRALKNGHVQLGGRRGSPDPFIDFCVFKHSQPGTVNAIFGSDFARDVGFRDFACNSVYYDPMNEVLIDPTGMGVEDAEQRRLNVVCNKSVMDASRICKISIRYFKFYVRGFSPSETCAEQIMVDLAEYLPAVPTTLRIGHINSQILGKYPKSEHAQRMEEFRSCLIQHGANEIWEQYIAPFIGGDDYERN